MIGEMLWQPRIAVVLVSALNSVIDENIIKSKR